MLRLFTKFVWTKESSEAHAPPNRATVFCTKEGELQTCSTSKTISELTRILSCCTHRPAEPSDERTFFDALRQVSSPAALRRSTLRMTSRLKTCLVDPPCDRVRGWGKGHGFTSCSGFNRIQCIYQQFGNLVESPSHGTFRLYIDKKGSYMVLLGLGESTNIGMWLLKSIWEP